MWENKGKCTSVNMFIGRGWPSAKVGDGKSPRVRRQTWPDCLAPRVSWTFTHRVLSQRERRARDSFTHHSSGRRSYKSMNALWRRLDVQPQPSVPLPVYFMFSCHFKGWNIRSSPLQDGQCCSSSIVSTETFSSHLGSWFHEKPKDTRANHKGH